MSTYVRTGRSHFVAWRYGPGTPNGKVVDSLSPTISHTSSDTKTGSKNPGWRRQITLVQQAGTPYSRSAQTYGFVTGSLTGRYYENAARTIRAVEVNDGELFLLNHPPLPPVTVLPSIDVNARINFLQKCRSATRSFEGGTALGELRQTINMIARPGAALRRGIGAYLTEAKKVARRTHFSDRGRILTKTWLEYSYGWRPFFRDIDSAIDALTYVDHLIPEVVVGSSKDTYTSGRTVATSAISGSKLRTDMIYQNNHKGSVRYLGCVAWESDPSRARAWESPNWGLTLSDFIPTVWNLIPYSFIVDYFTNVGQVIDASSFGEVGLRWGVRSTVLNSSVQMFQGPVTVAPGANVFSPSAGGSLSLSQLSNWSFNRTLVSKVTVGLNDLQFRVPGVSDWRKWANLAALAIDKAY